MTIRVFISYSHDSGAHAERVLALADKLRGDGLDVRLDQYVAHPAEGWPQWMRRQIVEADFVLLVCTPTYRRRYDREEEPGKGLGAAWEASIAEQLLYEAGTRNEKLVPVLFDDGSDRDIPVTLRSYTHYRVHGGYEDLYRRLTNQPKTPPPPVGTVRTLAPAPRQSLSEPASIAPRGPIVDNTGANIGQQVVVNGSATFGAMTITMPTPAPAAAPAPAPAAAAPTAQPPTTPAPTTPATILLCTANAMDPAGSLRIDQELRAIDDALQRSRVREGYDPRPCLAVTFSTVLRELVDREPAFLHFSGHGDPSGRLVLLGERGGEQHVDPQHIAALLGELRTSPTLVTFATCHSHQLARAAARHVAFAIGFEGPLDDEAAPLFSATLYEHLASRPSPDVPQAFRLARLACLAAGHVSVELARLYERPGREVG